MTVQDYVALATSVFTLLTAIFIGWQVRKMTESISLTRLQNQHLLCIELWKQYTDAFSDRQELLQNPILLGDLEAQYPSVDDIVNSGEYKRLKRVAGIYELAGAMVASGAIDRRLMYQYVSVPRQLWDSHWPLIRRLRGEYYPGLWIQWEQLAADPENMWPYGRLEAR
jgi:hypothetical protein